MEPIVPLQVSYFTAHLASPLQGDVSSLSGDRRWAVKILQRDFSMRCRGRNEDPRNTAPLPPVIESSIR